MIVSPEQHRRLRDAIHAQCFTPASDQTRAIGAEVELLALGSESNRPVALEAERGGLIETLRAYGERHGWREIAAVGGMTKFDVPGRALVSFEPGGQIEISSVPCDSVNALVALLHDIVRPLRADLLERGITLTSIGIDPFNDARDIPLQLHAPRYERMTAYFERIGPFGIRMMRQTAAMQVSLDRGATPSARWRLLNDLAPYLIAIFANSSHYLGEEAGHRSYRAHCWRQLDPTRTGVVGAGGDAADEYAAFALAANDMMRTTIHGESRSFEWWMQHSNDLSGWDTHLTTLFPEVRPRGHFEVRSCDAVPVEWYAVPLVLLSGIAYDDRASREAAVLAAESRVLLRAAGQVGLADASLARTARDLFQLGLQGARRLGSRYVSGDLLDTCDDYYSRFTARDASPADEANLARMRTVRSRSSRV
ncbi:MAG TPA: glutamate-cysteine ligase family protein [Gemmatimonadaceae bacterium]|nr:glutamate-cysteine ligase family protein [Gemmatimonadaceae bacterium]